MVGRRWEAFFGIDDGDDFSDSSSVTSADKMSLRSGRAKPGDGGAGGGGALDDPKAEARSNKKVSCLKPKRPVVMSADG